MKVTDFQASFNTHIQTQLKTVISSPITLTQEETKAKIALIRALSGLSEVTEKNHSEVSKKFNIQIANQQLIAQSAKAAKVAFTKASSPLKRSFIGDLLERLVALISQLFSRSTKNNNPPAKNIKKAQTTPSPQPKSHGMSDTTPFKQDDYNYKGYSELDQRFLVFAMNCCAFPKLALYLKENHPQVKDCCRQINDAHGALKSPKQMTAQDVLNNSKA